MAVVWQRRKQGNTLKNSTVVQVRVPGDSLPGFGYATFQPPHLYDGAFYFEIMGKAKFTPGPWRGFNPNVDGIIQHDYWAIEAGGGYLTNGFGLRGYIEPEDARLIAAAPDLYEALQEAKLQIEYLNGKFTATGTGNAVLSKIEAALEKADGVKTEKI